MAILFTGCNGGVVDRLLKKSSPYEKYLETLESTSLKDFALVRDWKAVGEQVLRDSLQVTLPHQEVAFFDPQVPKAMLLRYPVLEGQEVMAQLNPVTQKDAHFFMDIFEVDAAEQRLKRIHFADSSGTISYQVHNSGIHALRIQPELFRGGVFTLSIGYQGLLSFPLVGKGTVDIASFWGDPRDGDARKHEGVDIFSRRGTPVVAASSGSVRRVGNNRLGGKVVWLHDRDLGISQYYAHLDSQLVQPGEQVNAGDTIGLVGNTGNAITTAPHLHFGIYRSGRGAVDPFPFLQDLHLPDDPDLADSVDIGSLGTVTASSANVRHGPSTSSDIIANYERNTLLQIEGKSGNWYRITLPDGQKGFIYETLAEKRDSPLREIEMTPLDEVWELREESTPVTGEIVSGKVLILGEFEGNYYVETASGFRGWWKVR